MSETPVEALQRIAGTMEEVDTARSRLNACIYGPSDAGKTVLAVKLLKEIVKEGQTIVTFETSTSSESLKNHRAEGLTTGVRRIPFTTIEDIEVVIQAIRFKVAPFDNVGGILLDEGSSMAQIDTDRIYENRVDSGNGGDDLTPAWPDYHAALQRFRSMLAKVEAIPGLHIIVTAHVGEKKDSKGNVLSIFPSFSDKIAKKVKEPMQLVAYLTAEYVPNLVNPDAPPTYRRVAQVHMTPQVDAKARIGGLPVRVSDDGLIRRIREWVQEGEQEVEELPEQPEPEKVSPEERISEDASEVDLDFEPV